MGHVSRLPEAVANQIAAGEVVERPASVVKELVENAVDAGATRIDVEVEQGGARRIRVADDGEGMTRADALACLERHATSKIRDVEDLARIHTLGFRGEALPSIASVARFRLTTRRADADAATRVAVEGTAAPRVESCGAPVGTEVRVDDLFFNVPARRKFMRRPSTEMGHVTEAVARLALASPEIAFRLRAQDRVVLDVPAADAAEPRGRIGRVLGRATAERLVPIPPDDRPHVIGVEGFVSEPGLCERTSRSLYVFLNGRFVRDRGVQHAIVEPYRTLIERGRFPVAVVWLHVDPEAFDVNVHPQKTEVRFRSPQEIHRAVFGALVRALEQGLDGGAAPSPSRWAQTVADARPSAAHRAAAFRAQAPWTAADGPPVFMFPPRPEGLAAGPGEAPEARADGSGLGPTIGPDGVAPGPPPPGAGAGDAPFAPTPVAASAEHPVLAMTARARPLGLAFGRYLVAEEDDRLVLVDLRGVVERRRYEARIRAARTGEGAARQRLLVPRVVELSAAAAEAARAASDDLAAVGFEVEDFGGASVAIVARPADVDERDVEALLVDLLAAEPGAGPDTPTRRRERWARRAARAATGAVPDHRDAWLEILDALARDPALRRSLDGRPTRIELSSSAVARLFEGAP